MDCRKFFTCLTGVGMVLLWFAYVAHAGILPGAAPLAPEVLNSIRGSYLGANGAILRFSIDVSTYKNMELQDQSSLNFRRESGFNWSRERSGDWGMSGDDYIFNLVQNHVDDVVIRHVMQINIDVNKQLMTPVRALPTALPFPCWR